MRLKKILSLFMMGVMFSANIPFNVFAEEITNDTTITEDELVSGSALAVSDSSIDVEFNITGQWEGGFNGEIKITNLTDVVIENWQIQMEFPQEITNIWNASIDSHEGMVYNIRNAGNNNNINIPVGESVTFGFSGTYEDSITSPSNVKLVQSRADVDEEAYTIEYSLLSDWGSGYSAQITITNNTDKPFEAWHLSFDFDRNIDSIWNAVIEEHTDNKYYISNAEYNSVIPANSSISFGFNGSSGTSETKPNNYTLNVFGLYEQDILDETEEGYISNADYYLMGISYAEGDFSNSVTQDLRLPTLGLYSNSIISWSSSDETIIDSNGKVTRPTKNSKFVTLTANYTDTNGSSVSKDFTVKVIKKFINAQIPIADFDVLEKLNGGGLPEISFDDSTDDIIAIKGKYADYLVESPEEAIYSLNALCDLMGIKDPRNEYVFLDYTDLDNIKRFRLQQVYENIPIKDSNLIITTDASGNIKSINGHYHNIINYVNTNPQSDIFQINKIIKAPTNNSNYNFEICNDDGEYTLCWCIYNESDGNVYYVRDDNHNILLSFENYSGSAVSNFPGESGKKFDVNVILRPESGSIFEYENTFKKQQYNIKKYVQVNKDYISDGDITQNNRLYTTDISPSTPISINNGESKIVLNFADTNYGKYITNKELFDMDRMVMYLTESDKGFHIIDYDDIMKNSYPDAIPAYQNMSKAIDFFRTYGIDNALDILGFELSTSKARPLYVMMYNKPVGDFGSYGQYSQDNRCINFGRDNNRSGVKFDTSVHELTHGLMYNKGHLKSDSLCKKSVHEAYGDIMACIANSKFNNQKDWIFEREMTENELHTAPRDIATISKGKSSYFRTSLNATEKQSLNENTGGNKQEAYYYSTILSCAAYKMNKGLCGVAINDNTLGKIWFNSITLLNGDEITFDIVADKVIDAAEELGCNKYQMSTIKTAFTEAGIYNPKPTDEFYGKFTDVNGQKVYNYKLIVSSGLSSYKIRTIKDNYILYIYNASSPIFTMDYSADGYLSGTKQLYCNLSNSPTREDIVLTPTSYQQTAYINLYVFVGTENMKQNNFNTNGITVNLYDYDTNDLVFKGKVNGTSMCVLYDIPYGNYIIEIVDNRILENEALRLKDIKQPIYIGTSYGNMQAIIVNKYTEGGLYLYYENSSSGEETPLSNTSIDIKKADSDDIWYSAETDSEGVITWYYEEGKTYIIYADGEKFTTIET